MDAKSMDTKIFVGNRALVTGAGKGIGRAVAIALLEGGADTIALSRTQADLDSLKQEYPQMQTVCLDISDWDKTRRTVQDLGSIDLLVNNAGVASGGSFLDATKEDLDRVLEVNVKAMFNISQVVAKALVEKGKGGAIVNLSSVSGKIGMNLTAVYCVSKGAVEQLTRAMALDLGPHQRSNMHVVSAILYLLSDEAEMIHGTSLVVDGGLLAV